MPRFWTFAAILLYGCQAYAQSSTNIDIVGSQVDTHCVSASRLELLVTRQLGYNPWHLGDPNVISVRVRREGTMMSAHITLFDESHLPVGTRTIRTKHNDCAYLSASIATAISLAIDPVIIRRRRRKSAQQRLGDKAASERSNAIQTRLVLDAKSFVALGTVPQPTAGLALGVGLRRSFWSVSIEGRFDAAGQKSVLDDGRVRALLGGANVLGCAHFHQLFGCATFLLATLRGSAQGLPQSRAGHAFYGAGGLRTGLTFEVVEALMLTVFGEFLAPIARVSLGDEQKQAFWRTSTISGTIGGGVGTSFDL